ncbi:MAG: hypothetical protein HRT45_06165, partial [Bdellovibrionales bacterium]|nr:hypothetical protein [Bdellovibrionales bacterium]
QRNIYGLEDFENNLIDLDVSEGVLQVAAGTSSICLLTDDRTVSCAGGLGDNTAAGFQQVQDLGTDVRQISSGGMGGYARVCSVNGSGQARCFPRFPEFEPWWPEVEALNDVAQVEISQGHTGAGCILNNSAEVFCWGVLGTWDSDTEEIDENGDPVRGLRKINGLPPVLKIAAGGHWGHYCAISFERELYCWGMNQYGQVGVDLALADQQSSQSFAVTQPHRVEGIGRVRDVSLGAEHSCALNESHEVYCWGQNMSGQLGNRLYKRTHLPQLVGQGASDLRLSASGNATHIWDSRGHWATGLTADLTIEPAAVLTSSPSN